MNPITTKLDLLLDQRSATKDDNYIPDRRSIPANKVVSKSNYSTVSQK